MASSKATKVPWRQVPEDSGTSRHDKNSAFIPRYCELNCAQAKEQLSALSGGAELEGQQGDWLAGWLVGWMAGWLTGWHGFDATPTTPSSWMPLMSTVAKIVSNSKPRPWWGQCYTQDDLTGWRRLHNLTIESTFTFKVHGYLLVGSKSRLQPFIPWWRSIILYIWRRFQFVIAVRVYNAEVGNCNYKEGGWKNQIFQIKPGLVSICILLQWCFISSRSFVRCWSLSDGRRR